jgi:hypothetical protein
MMFPLLFKSHVILDRIYALDATCNCNRFVNIGVGTHEAAQLNLTFEGFNVDLSGVQVWFFQYGRLNLAGDDTVVNIFPGSLLLLR